ncbi:MAG: hypothetical protein FJ298_05535 [Planctomycetes bacterium]|nr:hypothetical protein [Planctomycetota bacterium]
MRASAALIAAAIALALAVVLWLFLPAGVEEVGAAESDAGAAATPELAARLGSLEERAASERRDTQHGEVAPAAASAEDANAEATSALRAVDVLRVTDHAPMAGVEVLWWPLPPRDSGAPDLLGQWLRCSGDEASLPEGYERAVSNAKGVVLLPDTEFGTRVFARCEGWSGRAEFAPGETPPMRIELHRDAALAVHVVDRAGQPAAGVTVGVVGDLSMRGYAQVRAQTDERGLARFPHAYHRLGDAVETSVRLAVVLEELTLEPVGQIFDARHPPVEPIELVLSDGGECEVRVVDRDGELVREPLDVQLTTVGDDEIDISDFQPWWGNEVVRREAVTGGSALFRAIAPDIAMIATASRPDGLAHFSARVPRIRRALERVSVEIVLDGSPRVVGRALREDGTPLASSSLGVRYLWTDADGATRAHGLEVKPHTDELGRFELELSPSDWGNGEDESRFELVQVDARGDAVASAPVTLPARLTPGVLDVGDVRLLALPLLASGVTLDAQRRPLGGVRVSVYAPAPDGDNENVEREVSTAHALSDAAGRFCLRLSERLHGVRIEAGKDELRSERVAIERGASDVELVLSPGGQIAGRVEWNGLGTLVRLFIRARMDGSGEGESAVPWVPVLADGRFFVRGMRPGRYAIDVRTLESAEPLASVEGVDVRGGETTRDPRLDPISLGGALRVATLTITDGSGEPLSRDLNVIARYANTTGDDYQWIPIIAGRAAILVRDPPPSVSVMGDEYLTQYIEMLTDDRTVVMRPAPTVHFQLTERVALPPDITLGINLEHERGDRAGFSWHFEQPEFDEHGRAALRARLVGNYKLTLRATLRGENWKTMQLDMPPVELHIRELPAEQTFEVRCPEEPLKVVLEALRRP